MCFLHSVKWEKRERRGGVSRTSGRWKAIWCSTQFQRDWESIRTGERKLKKRLALEIQAEFPCFWKKPLKYLCVFWRWMLRLVFSKVDFPCKSRSGSFEVYLRSGVISQWLYFNFRNFVCPFILWLCFLPFLYQLSLSCLLFVLELRKVFSF